MANKDLKEVLKSFIEWAEDQSDVFYIFDYPDDAINRFLEEYNK